MTTLTTRLPWPNIGSNVLTECTAGERLKHWTAAGGGYTNTYYATTIAGASRPVNAVNENGTALTERASIALTNSNAASWYWDRTNSRIYVHPTGSVSPYTKTIQSTLMFCFAIRAEVLNGRYYEGRLSELPMLSSRVETKFGDPGKIGGGNISFQNEDGFFDALASLDWNAGTCTLKMGADNPLVSIPEDYSLADGFIGDSGSDGFFSDPAYDGFESAASKSVAHTASSYADYDTMGTWRITGWEKDLRTFKLVLEERMGILKKKIPVATWERSEFPSLREDDEGKPKQIAYGYIYDAKPVCVDTVNYKFRVAGHAIKDFLDFRVIKENADGLSYWVTVTPDANDEATAEFTLNAADWDGSADVACDFIGRKNADNSTMENASDVIADLIFTQAGELAAYKDATSFAASRTVLLVGTDSDGAEVSRSRISMYIDKEIEVTKVISQINEVVGSYVFCDKTGKYKYIVFDPQPGQGSTTFTDSEVADWNELIDAEEMLTSLKVEYQHRQARDYPQTVTCARTDTQYWQGASAAVSDVAEEVPLDRLSDARYFGQRTIRMRGEPIRTFTAKLSRKAWTLEPGDTIIVTLDDRSVNNIFEVLGVKRNLAKTAWVSVVLSDFHGMGDQTGFWTAESPTLPTRFASLAGYGSGAASPWNAAWHADIKAWARQNLGYWTDEYGFADSTDPDSYMPSVWI